MNFLLLLRMFEYDPAKRISPEEALLHPFLSFFARIHTFIPIVIRLFIFFIFFRFFRFFLRFFFITLFRFNN